MGCRRIGVDAAYHDFRLVEAGSIGIRCLFSFNTAAVSTHALILPEDSPVGRQARALLSCPRAPSWPRYCAMGVRTPS